MEIARFFFFTIILISTEFTASSMNCKMGECLCSFSQCIISETNKVKQKEFVINCCKISRRDKNETSDMVSNICSNGYSLLNFGSCTKKIHEQCRRDVMIYMMRAFSDIVEFFNQVKPILSKPEKSSDCEEYTDDIIEKSLNMCKKNNKRNLELSCFLLHSIYG